MNSKTYEPVKIQLVMHGRTYTIEGLNWDSNADELLDSFKRLLVCAGFSPTVLDNEDGHYEWVGESDEAR